MDLEVRKLIIEQRHEVRDSIESIFDLLREFNISSIGLGEEDSQKYLSIELNGKTKRMLSTQFLDSLEMIKTFLTIEKHKKG
jgi:hypothetical protein